MYVGLRVRLDGGTRWADVEEAAVRRTLGDKEPPVRAHIGELLAAARQIIVLGDPGAGKSTLLRWIATAYLLRIRADPDWAALPDVPSLPDENWLPILVRCRELDGNTLNGTLEEILGATVRKAEMPPRGLRRCLQAPTPPARRR